MPFDITLNPNPEAMSKMMWKNTTGKRLYVNEDHSKVVQEGSPEAAFVLVGPEGSITMEEAKKYNLHHTVDEETFDEADGDGPMSKSDKEHEAKIAESKAVEPNQGKAVEPAQNKAIEPDKNK